VTGVPGTGKTPFAHLLAETLGCQYVDLNQFLINGGCVEGYDEELGSFVVDLGRGKERVMQSFSQGLHILESHVSHLVVPKEILSICFVLRASPYILRERLSSKGFDERKVKENCAAEILDIILQEALERYGRELVCELDTSYGVEEAVGLALKVLKEGTSCPPLGRDWLAIVAEKGDLGLFFE
jgi:adenylate kinase